MRRRAALVGRVARLALFAALALRLGACKSPPSASDVVKDTSMPSAVPSSPRSAPARASNDAAMSEGKDGVRVVPAAAEADALSIVRTERLRAKGEGRVLVVYVSAGWCEPCKRLKEEIRAGRLDATLPRVTLLAFDADRDTERLASAGYAFEFVPFVALPGPDGRPLDTEQARGSGGQAWREVVTKLESWQSRAP